jgi:hypothetical protein
LEEFWSTLELFIFFVVRETSLRGVYKKSSGSAENDAVIRWWKLKMIILEWLATRVFVYRDLGSSQTFTTLSQCWAPVCLMKPSGALIDAKVALLPKMRLPNSGKR